ncbi:hypothetical protein B6S12_10080 [Helicobacter valdiviensis]|uniref:Uncharacterized protein n=1 Tax=Helicobacter valdiviensis TaxID=1458358 RepID=A0A2W6PKP5_9HELI|nr:hypothetical protein [Helicobacter valdiviensis]PZT47243.1 hypothetical protein B6S12_10080 [Helicobacter valdiviensis]
MFNTKIQVFYSYVGYRVIDDIKKDFFGDGITTIVKPIWKKWNYIDTYSYVREYIKNDLSDKDAIIHILQFHKL